MSKEIVENALGKTMAARIWTGTYLPVFGCTPSDFSVEALLPAIMYMFRWGHRRGKGKFFETYTDKQHAKWPTVKSIASKLSVHKNFEGFSEEIEKGILGDMLLSSAIENARRAEGHTARVIRCFAPHYSASWVDLPEDVVNLRGVPELIVSLIANQSETEIVETFKIGTRFPVGCGIKENIFLDSFAKGIYIQGNQNTSQTSDTFNEQTEIGIDQLLVLRLAQECEGAPLKAHRKINPIIPNQRPISTISSEYFRKDIINFFSCYSETIPRRSFLPLLESCFSVGLTSIILSTLGIIEYWDEKHSIFEPKIGFLPQIFMDCSVLEDRQLTNIAERSNELIRNRLSRVPVLLMQMRLIQEFVRQESSIHRSELPPQAPNGKEWLELLGSIAGGTHKESRDAELSFRRHCRNLSEELANESGFEALVEQLQNENNGESNCVRLSEAICSLMNIKDLHYRMNTFFNSCLMLDQPNGLAYSRRVKRRSYSANKQQKSVVVHSFVLSNSTLEYLVHRHLRNDGKNHKSRPISFPKFLDILRERYGFCVDRSPPDMDIPGELLQRNRRILERRLRDLGLLVGVNDAERMKRLRQRYPSKFDTQFADEEAVQA